MAEKGDIDDEDEEDEEEEELKQPEVDLGDAHGTAPHGSSGPSR